jgi:tricorn protease
MNKLIGVRALAFASLISFAPFGNATEIKLARYPDYHEGKIVFSYLGDIWIVQDDGSNPRRLTVHNARAIHPRFSPNGKWIAFSSTRYGNYDVFVMSAEGGTARRLTFHSAPDLVVGWSRDSERVLFSSARGRLYPGISNLYEVPVQGGLEQPVATDWGCWGSYSPDGTKLAFNRHPMVWWRKHYRGSYAADLWVMDVAGRTFRRILDNDLPDEQKPNNFWPMYGNGEIFFVSDRAVTAKSGSNQVLTSTNNIWKVREDGSDPVQLTHHTSGSLFWPSLSSDGKTIVYEENFGLWKLDVPTSETHEIKINIQSDDKDNNLELLTVNGDADSFHLSPSSKRAVITTHGELFTIATEKGDVSRVTHSPGARETDPQWSHDGKWIAFVSDQNGREEVWVCDENGNQARRISDNDAQKSQISWSPDSQSLLYTGSDRKLYKHHLPSSNTAVLASGEVIGFGGSAIQQPQWSPDGKWVAYTKGSRTLLPHIYVVSADGGAERRVTDEDSYSDSSALWTPDGKRLIYLSGIDVSNIGPPSRATAQIYTIALAPEEKDPFDKNIDSEEQAAAADKDKPRGANRGRGNEDESDSSSPVLSKSRGKVEVKIDWNHIGRRARQLTRTADSILGMAVSPDSKLVAFSTLGTEGGRPVQSLWTMQLDGDKLTRAAQSGRASEDDGPPAAGRGQPGFTLLQFSKDGRNLFYRQEHGIFSVALGGSPGGRAGGEGSDAAPSPPGGRGSASPFSSSAGQKVQFMVKVEIDHRAERRQVFEESWRVMKHRFYAADMHGVNWQEKKQVYEPLLAHVADQEELHNVVSMMIGELNASHTGISSSARDSNPQTRFPGFELKPDASGFYKVAYIYRHGPADKDYVKIHVGDFLLAIDGQDLKAGDTYWKDYTESPGSKMVLTVNSKPAKAGAWTTRVAPISSTQYSTLQYEKWVDDRRQLVEKLTDGAIGYLHIRQMNEASLRQFERDLAELHHKKALIIDQRFNPGGNIDQELLQILGQKQYQYTRVRDSIEVRRPLRGFFGPMVVLQNERSTSDAEVFPDGFRTLHLGKLVGVTTYGAVIGTGAHTLMDGSVIRTPGSGLWNVKGTNLENYGVPPDVYVDNSPEDFLKGRDAQLEKAVQLLQEEMNQKK